MPRRPRITGRDLIRALERRGFAVRRVRGSHHILYDERGKRVTVAVHGTQIIPPGTVGNILAAAGITDEELVELLEQ